MGIHDKGNRILSEIVYLRTYSRFKGNGKKEKWHETVDRVVEFTGKIGPCRKEELEKFRYLLLNKKAFPAGRTLWVGGTPISYKYAETNYNCSFLKINSVDDFHDLQLLLMSAAGVGFRIRKEDAQAINKNNPLVNYPKISIIGKSEQFWGFNHSKYTKETVIQYDGKIKKTIIVGDSREGWAEAIRQFLLSYSQPGIEQVIIDVRSVRPKGTPLATFGGHASGPEPLIEFFLEADKVLKREPLHYWTPVKMLDIANLLGRATVAGGTRRSAEIALGSCDDLNFVKAKTGDWYSSTPWREQSNNSVIFDEYPGDNIIEEYFNYAAEYGEPGFVNRQAFCKTREDWEGINPCAEISLCSYGTCNLATINLPMFVENGEIDVEGIAEALKILTRHAMRITNISYSPHLKGGWQKVQDRDRLIGISLTGVLDALSACNKELKDFAPQLQYFRRVVHESAKDYASEMGVPVPILMTTIKPEGTLSLVGGVVSPGVHYPYAPYYARRVVIDSINPILEVWKRNGLEIIDHPFDSNRKIIELPIRSSCPIAADSVSAKEQLENYKVMVENYVDHNVSVSIYFKKEEIPEMVKWIRENWNIYRAISFFPKFEGGFDPKTVPLLAIDEKTYKEMLAKLPDDVDRFLDQFYETIKLDQYTHNGKFHTLNKDDQSIENILKEGEQLMGESNSGECIGGNCPIR